MLRGFAPSPLPSKRRRFRPDDLPIEEVLIAGPRMDLGVADAAFEIT